MKKDREEVSYNELDPKIKQLEEALANCSCRLMNLIKNLMENFKIRLTEVEEDNKKLHAQLKIELMALESQDCNA